MTTEPNLREVEGLAAQLDELRKTVEGLGHRVAEAHGERASLGFQAEWHIRGVLYHTRRLFEHHVHFVREVCARASTGASVLIMYAPSYQEMLFELYSLVNLCRISLDNLRTYLRPLFVQNSHQLPKSIREVLAGTTDCPIYQSLAGQPLVEYLIDLRTCLVHYRSFATSDNAYVVEEGTELLAAGEPEVDAYLAPMARASFRRVGENAICVSVLLPDRIFEASEDTRLAKFTYEERWSLASTARNFAQLTIRTLAASIRCLIEVEEPIFTFSAKKRRKHS